MPEMTATARKLPASISALGVALLTVLCSYWLFRWGFIRLWEWQHEGRRIVFALQQEIDAAVTAFFLGISVFVIAFRRVSRKNRT
jgi:hypothetical protein